MSNKTPKFLRPIISFFDSIHIPFLGISLWEMLKVYGNGIFRIQIGRMAAGISWSFFLSLFPFLLFLLSVLPNLPHYDKLQFYIMEVLVHRMFPTNIQGEVSTYLETIFIPNTKKLSNWTIAFALFFATNGTYALIRGFNSTTELRRGDLKEYFVAFAITLSFVLLIVLSLFGIYYSEVVLKLFTPKYDISWLADNLSKIIGFISFPVFYLLLLTTLYWVGCLKITKWKQAFPGALLSTALFMLLTYFFTVYLKDFSRYNVLYGSIGTIILMMVWVNLNIVLIILGNELNIAIKTIRMEKMIADEVSQNAEFFDPEILPELEATPQHHEYKIEE